MRIRLRERRSETADVITFIFDLGGQLFEYQSGQFVFYELDALDFPDERGNCRHFTISSSPTEKGIVMFTTRMRGSGFKETLRHAPMGYEVTLGTPLGNFIMPEGLV
jgi:ferredoxin-NADP reductase